MINHALICHRRTICWDSRGQAEEEGLQADRHRRGQNAHPAFRLGLQVTNPPWYIFGLTQPSTKLIFDIHDSPIDERNKVYVKCDAAPATRESMRLAVASTDMRAVTRVAENNNAASHDDVLQGMGDSFDEPGEWDLQDAGGDNRGEGEDLYFDVYD